MKIDSALLDKYFKGQCSDAEQAVVEAYFDAGNTPELDTMMKQVWDETTLEIRRKPRVIYRGWYAAAAAVLALGIALGWAWQQQKPQPLVAAVTLDTIYNSGRTLKSVKLPDGSQVVLGSFTRLVYQTSDVREVWMDGEAFFEVNADEQNPFLVHTGVLTTTVLGTSFNISTRNRADSSIEVCLVKGKVAVNVEDGKISFSKTLQPGQMISYKKGRIPSAPGRFSYREVLDWKSGKLVFEHTTLGDAFARMESRFGCNIIVSDKQLLQKRVSAVFSAGTNPERILESLGYVHRFSFTSTKDNTYMVGKSK